MRLAIFTDDGQLAGTYSNGKLALNTYVDKSIFAFELFQLMVQMMNVGGGASYGGPLAGESGGDYGDAEA